MKIINVLAGFILFSSAVHATQPFKEITLADWGLSDVSNIGFASIGILHHDQKEDEIVVYDIRKDRPTITEPTGSRGKVPAYSGDYFLLANFDRGNINRLGGYFNTIARAPSKVSLAISDVPGKATKTRALRFSYHNTATGFAGFRIHLFDFKLPPSDRFYMDATPFSYLTFFIRSKKGGEAIMLQTSDRVWEKKQDSLPVGEVSSFLPKKKITTSWQQAWIPLSQFPSKIDKSELANLIFLVQVVQDGTIFIKDLAFTTKKDVVVPTVSTPRSSSKTIKPLEKAMWLWETEKLLLNSKERKRLIKFCKEAGITELFVQIPYTAGHEGSVWDIKWDSKKMRKPIEDLHKNNIRVCALDGDKKFALTESHGRVTTLVQRIIDYNASVKPSERFDGVRFDIEPYLLPQFNGKEKESILKQYLTLIRDIRKLTKKAKLPFGMDIPFWFDATTEFFEPVATMKGKLMSEQILDIVDNIGLMDYRTQAYGADGVIAHATDEINYASKLGKKVYIGLETVKLPDETLYQFEPHGQDGKTQEGKILIEPLPKGKAQLTFFAKASKDDLDGKYYLSQTSKVETPSSKLTFSDKSLKEFRNVIKQAREEFQTRSGFQGFVIHSYESFRPWLEKQNRKEMKLEK